ncbi:zinc dependent phospholipase C family protein [Rufibacter psychrotolerans]|uniref:zinc dependent phospholipase C family protein n=1 Tax=Rufibacter psychrotolerans TaxID=2812556 RepID=UPI00196866B5|nr:zinc dependent phospholipase C family protein [Rufibacter sp. SYSU D00308]
MPGPAIHHLIAQRLAAEISNPAHALHMGPGPEGYSELKKLLEDKAHLPYLFLGCQGPDFLFFNTKDMDPILGRFVEAYFKVYDFIERFKQSLLQAVPQPILAKLKELDEAANAVIEDSALLSSLQKDFEAINKLLEGLMGDLTEAVKEYVSEFQLFDQLDHPYRDGVSKAAGESWWWFDALHYRKTGKFAKALLDLSRGTPEHLYALGYLTHFAADTVGHPYVNIISGGPYRSHAQRHKTAENFQDVFNFHHTTAGDFNRSRLHALYNFNYTGTIKEKEGLADEVPDPKTSLPEPLAQLILKAINQVYEEDGDPSQVEYGRQMTTEDLNNTYRLWHKWFRSATDTGTLPAPVPYSFSKELREVWEKATDNLGEAGDFLKDSLGKAGKGGIWGILKALAAMALAPIMAAAAIADGVAGAIATMGSATIRYAACLIYEQLYDAFQNFRLGVALNGLAFPMNEHLEEPRFRQFSNPGNTDPGFVNASAIQAFLPLKRWAAETVPAEIRAERHLIYPRSGGELVHAPAAPASYFTKEAMHYAWGAVAYDHTALDTLASLTKEGAPAGGPDGTLLNTGPEWLKLGNALQLSHALYRRWEKGQPFPDFNLDADRGYGYLCWSRLNLGVTPQVPDKPDYPERINPAEPVHLQFIP